MLNILCHFSSIYIPQYENTLHGISPLVKPPWNIVSNIIMKSKLYYNLYIKIYFKHNHWSFSLHSHFNYQSALQNFSPLLLQYRPISKCRSSKLTSIHLCNAQIQYHFIHTTLEVWLLEIWTTYPNCVLPLIFTIFNTPFVTMGMQVVHVHKSYYQ